MIFLFPKEQLLVEMAVKKNSKNGAQLEAAIKKIYVHLPPKLLSDKYDSAITEEFLRALLDDSQKLGIEKYDTIVTEDETAHSLGEKCLGAEELQQGVFKSLGSYGLTKLIEDILKKMSESEYEKVNIEQLVELISARNAMRQNEEQFLEDAFRAYLKKQISLYE